MSTIVKRSVKGSPLTHSEMDANFENLNSGKLEKSLYSINNSILYRNSSGVVTNLEVLSSRILGRKSTGEITTLTYAEMKTLVGLVDTLITIDFLGVTPTNVSIPVVATSGYIADIELINGSSGTTISTLVGGAEYKEIVIYNNTGYDFQLDTTGNIIFSSYVPTPLTITNGEYVRLIRSNLNWVIDSVNLANGSHRNMSLTYVAPLSMPASGIDNTAMDIKTITVPANTLLRLGDRLRIVVLIKGTTGGAILGTLKLNGVTLTSGYVGGTDVIRLETCLSYVDNTHANVEDYVTSIPTVQVPGFLWDTSQDLVLSQDAVSSQHIDVYSITIDLIPIQT